MFNLLDKLGHQSVFECNERDLTANFKLVTAVVILVFALTLLQRTQLQRKDVVQKIMMEVYSVSLLPTQQRFVNTFF